MAVAGCSTGHPPPITGTYIDDASITSAVQARFVEDRTVDPDTVKIETRNGTVVLSGTARNSLEKTTAESVTMKVKGVKLVRNEIAVRP